jgi:undecaprenyl-diphosphatase
MPPVTNLETPLTSSVLPKRASRARSDFFLDAPIIRPRRGGRAERFAGSLGSLHPVAVFVVAMLGGLAVIAALSIGLGFFMTRVLEHVSWIGTHDEHVNVWLAAHRTPARTDASLIGSIVAGGVVLPIVAGVTALICVAFKHWRIAAFAVFALAVESATYRATTLVVHSHRPRVVRLENLPVNASYPSGHTAASVAVYGGLALLLTSRFTNVAFRAFAWTFVVAMVSFVAASRMYRGMHHPLDMVGGLVVGIAALVVIVFACRAAGAAAETRAGRTRA